MTAEEIYDRKIKQLPVAEKLRLAQLILNGISPELIVDTSMEWTDQDMAEFAEQGWR